MRKELELKGRAHMGGGERSIISAHNAVGGICGWTGVSNFIAVWCKESLQKFVFNRSAGLFPIFSLRQSILRSRFS
jgi:hypothetical protein